MRSPFPGMDPYLEAHWADVHARLIIYASEQLQRALPTTLRARVEERVFVENDEGRSRSMSPDVRVYERADRPPQDRSGMGELAAVEVAEPLLVSVADDPVTETFIEIREAGSGGRVVSVIEFVSAANKRKGEGRRLYLRKQRELHLAGVNSVEIDLLRGGKYVLAVPMAVLPPEYREPYRISVWRAARPGKYEVYRVPLEGRLPAIWVPLRAEDPDIALELQPLIDRCYETGAYNDIDYSDEPEPPLKRRHAAWAETVLRDKGLRASPAG